MQAGIVIMWGWFSEMDSKWTQCCFGAWASSAVLYAWCAVDIPFVKVLFEWCRSDLLSLPSPHLIIFEDVRWNFLFQGFLVFFFVLFCGFGFCFVLILCVWLFFSFFEEREWKFYEVRIRLSFSSECSLRENMAGGGGSSAQCMQTAVGGLLLLMCKVGRASFFWGLSGAYPEGRRLGGGKVTMGKQSPYICVFCRGYMWFLWFVWWQGKGLKES